MPIILPNDGSPISQSTLNTFFAQSSTINLPAGRYCFPTTFTYNFFTQNVTLTGVRGKTTITSYDNTPATNFAIPLKIDITKAKPKVDGVYQIDIIGNNINLLNHSSFEGITPTLDSYIKITNGVVTSISLSAVKALGYVTELDTNSADPGFDGLYVVSKHLVMESYGGGVQHLNLRYLNGINGTLSGYATSAQNVWYVQGTILKRVGGIWSRHYTGAGFATTGNFVCKDIIFDNCQFYLFSPCDIATIQPTIFTKTALFDVSYCDFKNVARVLSTMSYAGIDNAQNWYKASTYYSGIVMRFDFFKMNYNTFSSIYSGISWGTPPATNLDISYNTIRDCYTMFTCFNLFITNSVNPGAHHTLVTQNISNNNFINIRILEGHNWTTSLIRTSGLATVNNNQFINVTPQPCYLSGGDSKFSNNTVVMGNSVQAFSTCIILSKTGSFTNTIENNIVTAPLCSFLAIEGTNSAIIQRNKLSCCTKYRAIVSTSKSVNKQRIYYIRNVNNFLNLIKGITNDTFAVGNWGYFNKRTNLWEKLTAMPNVVFYSKVDEANDANQSVEISNNTIDCDNLTQISSGVPTTFKSVKITKNVIDFLNQLHNVSGTTIVGYTFSNNTVKGSANMVGTTAGITTLTFENNRFEKTVGSGISLKAANIKFNKNVFVEDKRYVGASVYADFGVTLSPTLYCCILTNASLGTINVDSNRFILSQSRLGCLRIETSTGVTLSNNMFTLIIPSYQTITNYTSRIAVSALSTAVTLPTSNIVVPEPTRVNTSLELL